MGFSHDNKIYTLSEDAKASDICMHGLAVSYGSRDCKKNQHTSRLSSSSSHDTVLQDESCGW